MSKSISIRMDANLGFIEKINLEGFIEEQKIMNYIESMDFGLGKLSIGLEELVKISSVLALTIQQTEDSDQRNSLKSLYEKLLFTTSQIGTVFETCNKHTIEVVEDVVTNKTLSMDEVSVRFTGKVDE